MIVHLEYKLIMEDDTPTLQSFITKLVSHEAISLSSPEWQFLSAAAQNRSS